jgi:hypothetical protein
MALLKPAVASRDHLLNSWALAANANEPAIRVESISFFMTKNFLFRILWIGFPSAKIETFVLLQNLRIYFCNKRLTNLFSSKIVLK